MRLLLDSHSFLWFCEGNLSLSPSARTAIEDSRNQVWVSHATAWELAIKISLKKLDLKVPYEELFPGAVAGG
jgi:PIN domain nuclease of toxin-antitoxin system